MERNVELKYVLKYETMSNGEIIDVNVQTTDITEGMSTIAGSVGIELDGTSNAGPFKVIAKVQGGWEHAFYVRANHTHMIACECVYTKNFIVVNQDSVSATSGPPYSVGIETLDGAIVKTEYKYLKELGIYPDSFKLHENGKL